LNAAQQTRQQQDRRRLGGIQEQMLGFQRDAAQRENDIAKLPMQSMVKPEFMDNRDVGQPGEAAPTFDQEGYLQRLRQIAGPVRAMQERMALTPKPQREVVSDNQRIVQFDLLTGRPTTLVDSRPEAPKLSTDYNTWLQEREKGRTTLDYPAWSRSTKQPATNVNVGTQRQENAFTAAQGKEFSELMGQINRESFAAPSQIRKLERMTQLLEGVDGGRLAPAGLEVASMANSLGIKIDPKLGNKEASQALAREIAGGFRQPGTGPMTDKDFDNFLLQVPDLSKTAEGRKQITQTMRNAANRNIKLGELARAYVQRNGQLDNGFMNEAAQFIAENPVVGDMNAWKVQR
jgi:hypothetical protein